MARQQRAARWMALAVAVFAAASVSAAVFVLVRLGPSAFMFGKGG